MEKMYQYLVGKNKVDITLEFGDQFNFYPHTIWSFIIGKDWLGKKIYLIIYFKGEKVCDVKIKKSYGKIQH